MGNKNQNTNYDILDKILADSDRQNRGGGKGNRVHDENGKWILTEEEMKQLGQSVDDIEKYLRS